MPPLPKPAEQRRRRNATIAMTKLPSEGRKGDPPEWPFDDMPEEVEQLWTQLWSCPQAAAWERLGVGCVRVVARYAVLLLSAERGIAVAATEVRQMEDRLGLTPLAMLRLRWEVAADEVAEQRTARTETSNAADPRRRLRIVDPAAASG